MRPSAASPFRPRLAALAILVAIPLAVSRAAAPAEPEGEGEYDVVIRYLLHAERDVSTLRFVAQVPISSEPGQTLREIAYEPAPSSIDERDGGRYATFDRAALARDDAPFRIEIRARLALHGADLAAARKRAVRPSSSRYQLELRSYVKPERFLESDAEEFRKLASRVAGEHDLDRIRSAFDLVIETLRPGPFDPGNHGALEALRRRRGDCTEYADMLTALLRADGRPARRACGFVFPAGDTPKHDWVEVFSRDHGWIVLDAYLAAAGKANFEWSPARYVRIATRRHDERLGGFHYYAYDVASGALRVTEEFEARKRED
jgi:transglutaminase-like putative cysteine protease